MASPASSATARYAGSMSLTSAAAVDQRGVALDDERGTAGDQHQGRPPRPQEEGAAGDAEHGQQAYGPEPPERGVVQGVLTQQHEDVVHVPAVAREAERQRADPEDRAVGQRGESTRAVAAGRTPEW